MKNISLLCLMLFAGGCQIPAWRKPIERPSQLYYSDAALPCPLCGDRAVVARWYKDPNYYSYKWPDDVVEKGWLYQCECRNKSCPVNPDTPALMREGDAINEWNEIAGREYR